MASSATVFSFCADASSLPPPPHILHPLTIMIAVQGATLALSDTTKRRFLPCLTIPPATIVYRWMRKIMPQTIICNADHSRACIVNGHLWVDVMQLADEARPTSVGLLWTVQPTVLILPIPRDGDAAQTPAAHV